MATVRFHKVVALPGSLEPDAFYLVENGNYSETYVTDSDSVAKMVGNSAMINALAAQVVTDRLADFNLIEIVATIAARDALPKNKNFLVLVTDATGDPTVSSGAALYVFNEGGNAFTKVAEYESMDVVLQWNNIQGRPSSSPASIDDAVGKRHAHANLAVLNGLSESAGKLQYNGAPVAGSSSDWATVNW